MQDVYGAHKITDNTGTERFFYVKCAGGGPAFDEEEQLAAEDGAAVEVSSSGGDSDADTEFRGAVIGTAAGVTVLVIGGFALWSRTVAPRAAAF